MNTGPVIQDAMTTTPGTGGGRAVPWPVAAAACGVLDQCARLLRAVSDDAYVSPSRVLPGGTIGKHVRHAIDHFAALVQARDQRCPVDYDHRERGVPMESVRADALAAIDDLRRRLGALGTAEAESPLRVRVMITPDGAEAELLSSFGRELAFAAHHAVHHHAMIKAIAAEHGHAAPEDFGTAPSTLAHQAR